MMGETVLQVGAPGERTRGIAIAAVWIAQIAVATMGGALFSHATRIGWSGNAAAEMWPLALVGFVAASWVVVVRYLWE
jgi:hypothetical protein